MALTYWLNLFSHATWTEFLQAGAKVTGFRESRWSTVQKVKPHDLMLCYLTGVSCWVGLLDVTGPAFRDDTPIWNDDLLPARLPVTPLIVLEPEIAVPITALKDRLSIFQGLYNSQAWTGKSRGSPAKWTSSDGDVIVAALKEAKRKPVRRPFDPAGSSRRTPISTAAGGKVVTVLDATDDDDRPETRGEAASDATAHTEIQWLLAKLGNDMGISVWVARNDRNRSYAGSAFTDLPRLMESLPIQFDPATTRTIELIDVLWLDGNSIKAAFEIESTTSVYSGLLRMADLVSMQPNLTIPLYLVAPAARRDKVKREMNRPTFSKLKTPLTDICRYIAFEEFRDRIGQAMQFVRHLNPQFLDDFAEVCDIEDA